jgi:uncharacterized membrane protein
MEDKANLINFIWMLLGLITLAAIIIACKGKEVCPAYTKGVHYHHPTV